MRKTTAPQQISQPIAKKVGKLDSAKEAKNSLESSRSKAASKPSAPKKASNVLDRANALCKIANENVDAMVDEQAQDVKKFIDFCQELRRREPSVYFSADDLRDAWRRQQEKAKLEHLWLRQQLDFLIDYGKWLVPGYVASRGPSGSTALEPINLFQGLVDDLLKDPRIDLGRFARCEICRKFFYKPRDDSHTCSRKCENVKSARRHYAKEKETRAKAEQLRNQGRTPFEIAHDLGISLAKVRGYVRLASRSSSR